MSKASSAPVSHPEREEAVGFSARAVWGTAFLRAVLLAVGAGARRHLSVERRGVLGAVTRTAYSTARAVFVTAVAAALCNTGVRHRLVYGYYILPWYLLNKNGVADHTLGRLLGTLTDDPILLELFKEHARVRRSEPCAASETRSISELDLAHWGGCLACQYWLIKPSVFERDHAVHVRLAAALHVLDDFLDQAEDQALGSYNYFVNHPAPVDVSQWVSRTMEARRFFSETNQADIVRLIDGSLTFYGLADETLFDAFYGGGQAAEERPAFVAPRALLNWRRVLARVF